MQGRTIEKRLPALWPGSRPSPLWRIAVLVSAAIAISYLDRQTLPVAVSAIAKEIPLTNQQFSALQSTFLFAMPSCTQAAGNLWTCWERGGDLPSS